MCSAGVEKIWVGFGDIVKKSNEFLLNSLLFIFTSCCLF